jgi:4-hydroxy-tetrahydrodipicolinate reductase
MTNVVITGSKGRMGQMLLACAAGFPEIKIVGAIDLGDSLAEVITRGDVVVDFSLHDATLGFAEMCAARKKAIVIGATGHSEAEKSSIAALKSQIPMVWASNYSMGVNTLFWLTRKAAEILGPGFDLEVVEMHHRRKQDAPSGTATSLAEILAGVRQQQFKAVVRHGRQGLTGPRTATEIGMHALRGGDVVGDHTVIFAGEGERIELTHRASSRETFAMGALRAACWAVKQRPGLYDMQDVLGLR